MKKNEIIPFAATWIGLEIILLVSEVDQKQTNIMMSYMWNLNHGTNEFIYKTESCSETQRTNLGLPSQEGRKGMELGSKANYQMCVMDQQRGPTVQHRELYSISYYNGKEYEKEYVTQSLYYTAEINPTLKINYMPIK